MPDSGGSRSRDLRGSLLRGGYGALRPVLFRVTREREGRSGAEAAHHGTVLAARQVSRVPVLPHVAGRLLGTPGAPVDLLGLRFPNAVGLAPGMDKDGVGLAAWQAVGFGHVELGTVTPVAQPGNPSPRLFRLPRSRAVINRMGFNNGGVQPLADRLRAAREAGWVRVPVGVSIGKNKVTPQEEAVEDYLRCVDALDGLADYLAVNVSSPNTPGLRALQDAGPLGEILRAVVERAAGTPVLVKLAPDLTDPALDQALEVALEAGVSGVIATNTTLARDGVAASERHTAAETGGLSGAPLTQRARQVVAHIAAQTDLPVIGVGGIMTGGDARAMLDAGASLVQVYTGLIYAGPALVREAAQAGASRGAASLG